MSTLMGQNEAETRLRAEMRHTNSGGIDYPSNTNSRGSLGGRGEQYSESGRRRERHAEGDVVGQEQMGGDQEPQQYAKGGVAMGGSNMAPDFHPKFKGETQGKQRRIAAAEANAYATGGEVESEFNRRSRAPLMRK